MSKKNKDKTLGDIMQYFCFFQLINFWTVRIVLVLIFFAALYFINFDFNSLLSQ